MLHQRCTIGTTVSGYPVTPTAAPITPNKRENQPPTTPRALQRHSCTSFALGTPFHKHSAAPECLFSHRPLRHSSHPPCTEGTRNSPHCVAQLLGHVVRPTFPGATQRLSGRPALLPTCSSALRASVWQPPRRRRSLERPAVYSCGPVNIYTRALLDGRGRRRRSARPRYTHNAAFTAHASPVALVGTVGTSPPELVGAACVSGAVGARP